MSSSFEEILDKVRLQLSKRGEGSIRGLALTFKLSDADKSGQLDVGELATCLNRCGVFLPQAELNRLFTTFDQSKDGQISYDEFLKGVQGQMNERRMGLTRLCFNKLDTDGSGAITLDEIKAVYNCKAHPKVKTGEMTEEQVLKAFMLNFEGVVGQNRGDGKIDWDEFVDYMSGVSASIPYDDNYFAAMIQACWGVKESDRFKGHDEKLDWIKKVIRDKVQQKKKKVGQTDEKACLEIFHYFDTDNSGFVDFDEFKKALDRFGILMDEASNKKIFASLDGKGEGKIAYDAFVKEIFKGEK